MQLELGGGKNPSPGFFNVDIVNEDTVDLVGDLRALFTPDVDIEDYPQLVKFQESNQCSHVSAVHFIEHIPWIYQDAMFKWINHILVDGGMFQGVTPNLKDIAKIYLKRKRSLIRNSILGLFGAKQPLFPADEHPDIKGNTDEYNLKLWTNFRIFSGCGISESGKLGDYHHCLYDKEMFVSLLKSQINADGECIWKNIKASENGLELHVFAVKNNAKKNNKAFF